MGVGRCGEEGRGEVLGWVGEIRRWWRRRLKEDIDPRGVEEHGAKLKKIHKSTTNFTISHPRNPTQSESLRLGASILACSVTEPPPGSLVLRGLPDEVKSDDGG